MQIAVLRIAAWSLLTSLVCANDPSAVIFGPNQGMVGDLIVLDASQSQAIGFAWVLADSDKVFLPVEDGRRVVFATGSPGRYTFVLVAATSTADGKPRVALAKHVLKVDSGPGPNPPPGPNPDPDPLPPGRFGLANLARDWVSLVVLPLEDRQRSSRLVAGSFETIATAIAAGTIASIPDALTKLVSANTAALSATELVAWKSSWNPKFNAAMSALDSGGKLSSVSDVADAFREIATGLRAVP